MSRDLDAAVTKALDPRLRLANDNPDCFLCGKTVIRANHVNIEYGDSMPLPAHSECCNNKPALDLFAAYWKAVIAAVAGQKERPAPGPVLNFRGERL